MKASLTDLAFVVSGYAPWRRSLLALAACVAVCLMFLALVLTFGIPYHFSIGGQL